VKTVKIAWKLEDVSDDSEYETDTCITERTEQHMHVLF
jgi:hypothetical protein